MAASGDRSGARVVRVVAHGGGRNAGGGGSAHGSTLGFRVLGGFIIGGFEDVKWGQR
jgi:hypothetical protein